MAAGHCQDPQAQLAINGTLQCNSIDLDRMLAVSSSPSAATLQKNRQKTAASAENYGKRAATIAPAYGSFSYQDLELDNLASGSVFRQIADRLPGYKKEAQSWGKVK